MADVQVVDFTERTWTPGTGSRSCTATGEVESKPAALEDYSLFAAIIRLGPGAELAWSDGHGDEVLAVLSGSLGAAFLYGLVADRQGWWRI